MSAAKRNREIQDFGETHGWTAAVVDSPSARPGKNSKNGTTGC